MEVTGTAAAALVWIDDLEPAVCWRLLTGPAVGRVCFTDDDGPMVLPVNYRVAPDDAIVFRTAWDTTLHGLAAGAAVAFEVDATNDPTQTGWSVVVRGTLTEIDAPADDDPLATLDVHPWAPGVRDRWMRIAASVVTGRAISRRRSSVDGLLLPYMPPD